MLAVDPVRAFGAVVGKALGSLRAGRGLVPVLVPRSGGGICGTGTPKPTYSVASDLGDPPPGSPHTDVGGPGVLADPGAFPLGALWRGIVSERQAMSDLLQPTGDLHHCHPKADSLLDEDAVSPTSGLLQPHLHECKILKGGLSLSLDPHESASRFLPSRRRKAGHDRHISRNPHARCELGDLGWNCMGPD
jgi:hypothetical protein